MYTTTDTARPGGIRAALRRAEDWLDAWGKPAWLAVMVLGFILFWPLGLALLLYMIWGKQMFGPSCSHRRSRESFFGRHGARAWQSTGNQAFDSYKVETLRRLEDEQAAFEAFLQRLRSSKDKTEFDAFMDERARTAPVATADDPDTGSKTGLASKTGPATKTGPA